MNDPFAAPIAALEAAREAWRRAGATPFEGTDAAPLVRVNAEVGAAKRLLDAVHTRVASEIARQSRPELGKDGLARKQGFRSPAVMIATTTGVTVGEAHRLVSVGEGTAPRLTLAGDPLPPKHPHVAAAITGGALGVAAAAAITRALDAMTLRVDAPALETAEKMLVERAPHLTLDQLGAMITRLEATLDPDGVAPKEDELRTTRVARVREDSRTGAITLTAQFDPENGAYVKAALDAHVTAGFRRPGSAGDGSSDQATNGGGGGGGGGGDDGPGHREDCPRESGGECGCAAVADDPRSMGQRYADALVDLLRHALGCTEAGFTNPTTTVVVRIDLADLEAGTGFGTIDGIAQPVSVGAVRRMAASGNVIPLVLGADSEVLDLGRSRRLFTAGQRLALIERDGGCAFCALPPHLTEAHHLRWWKRDHGPTDLANGVMLCTRCHHRVHDDGWEIEVRGTGVRAVVWFIPPPWLDPARTPRRGHSARLGLAA